MQIGRAVKGDLPLIAAARLFTNDAALRCSPPCVDS
jgi:hypothetical protein